MELFCPYCKAPIYSRKNKVCGVCEKPLPKEFLMSDAEKTYWKNEMDQEEKRTKEFEQQMDDLGPHGGHGGMGGMSI
jgi:uncharacterized Zn finger protein (UPF0148 family)